MKHVADMKNLLVLAAIALGTAYAFYLVWINRGSEKIVTAALPIAVAALLGIYLAIFVFGGEPPVIARFGATYLYVQADHEPVYVPLRRFNNGEFEAVELFKRRPAMRSAEPTLLYHHLLQKAIIEALTFPFAASWTGEVVELKSATANMRFNTTPGEAENSLVLDHAQLTQLLAGNFFRGVDAPMMIRLSLPPETKVVVKPPTEQAAGLSIGEISFSNPFCTVDIRTTTASGIRGIGYYARISGYNEQEEIRLWSQNYLVTVEAHFAKHRSGHPKMSKYKTWVEQIIRELRNKLDEEHVWQATRDAYILNTQIPSPWQPKEPAFPPASGIFPKRQ